jgi:hypothetical protein
VTSNHAGRRRLLAEGSVWQTYPDSERLVGSLQREAEGGLRMPRPEACDAEDDLQDQIASAMRSDLRHGASHMPCLAVFVSVTREPGLTDRPAREPTKTDHRSWLNRAMGVTGIEPVTSRV